jgi:hypothetical protein
MSISPDQQPAPIRRCGYSRCGQQLEYDGRGRPPEYCSDRRWPDGRTCRQLAATERAAERTVGLDTLLEAFRATGERFAPAAQTLQQQLAELLHALDEVREAALARMTTAEQAAADAATATTTAEQTRDQALQIAQSARQERDQAISDRDQATVAAEQTRKNAETVRAEAETRVEAAWRAVAEADHARGTAEAAAASQAASAAENAQKRQEAEDRAVAADARVTALADQLAASGSRIRELMTILDQSRVEHDAAASRAEAALAAAQERSAAAVQRAETAERDLGISQQQRDTAEHALTDTRSDLAAALAARDEARARAVSAEKRLDLVITALGHAATQEGSSTSQ